MVDRRRAVRATVWAALVALQVVVVVTLALAGPDDMTHRAPIRIVGPPVVAASVVDTANDMSGRPVVAKPLATDAQARASVMSGRSVAAVVIDLRNETDVLYVASANGRTLNRVLAAQVAEVESSFGRRAVVRDLVAARAGDAGHHRVYVMTGIAMLVGIAVAVVITWRRGPRAETLGGGARRQAVSVAVAVVAGGALAAYASSFYDTGPVRWWLVLVLTILAASTTTFALEALFGVVGIGAATTLLVLSAAPLVTFVHPLLLPEPWSALTPWLPHGAGLAAGTNVAYFGGDQVVRPVGVLVVWSALSILTTVVARRERLRG